MTEYEIAALGLAKAEGIRSQIEIVQGVIALTLECNTLYVSFISGYLALAYFLGAKLSSFQAAAVSVFYSLMVVANRSTFYSLYIRFKNADRDLAILKNEEAYTGLSGELTLAVTMTMLIASLYYMWNIRRTN